MAFPSKHPSRRCLCTTQHYRDRSRQFGKTLCSVLLTSQLSLECGLLLQRSHCVFHWDRVGSHARVEFKGLSQLDTADLWTGKRRVLLSPEFQTRFKNNRRAPHVQRFANGAPLVQQTRNREETGFNSAPLPYLPCMCSVSCAQLSFTLEPDNGLCNTHDDCACES